MFYLPTRIFFGENSLNKAKDFLKLGEKAFIVTGKSSAIKSGALDELLAVLSELKIAYEIYDGIGENPETPTVITGKEAFLKAGCDHLIAIGGGSPMDAAKAIMVAAANDLKEGELYQLELHKRGYPLIAIPTTHGTGSEVTQYSVLTDPKRKKKAGFGHDLLFAKLAIIDPHYMLSLPEKVSLDSSIDALSHLLEGIYSLKRVPKLYPNIFYGIRLILDNLPLCLKEPQNIRAREALAEASVLGGIAIAQAGTTLQHAIGYPFTSHFGISHGLANGMFLEEMMRFYRREAEDELKALFRYLKIDEEGFYSWLNQFPLKVKVEYSQEQKESWAEEILGARNIAASPRKPERKELEELMESVRK